jgi:glutamyl-tRNA synthetase
MSTRGGVGRFAPSPSGDLHLGNLRTALLAWLCARSTGRRFVVRVDDLDRARPGADLRQLEDLAALGITWDGPVLYESQRVEHHHQVLDRLLEANLTYECFCTRREVLTAASAPHAPQGAYPGTCRALSDLQRQRKRTEGRLPAVRLRSAVDSFSVEDVLHGTFTGLVDDFVLQRGDGVPAYNLTVVLDDSYAQVDQVVRGDDLLASAPTQAWLATRLGLQVPTYAHVPLALNSDGRRLAKRDGAVTLTDLVPLGWTPSRVLGLLATSLGLAEPGEPVVMAGLLARFEPIRLPRDPWIVRPDELVNGRE